MNALKLAQTRYATKKYDSSKNIPAELIEELKQVIRLTPSSINIQPWKFTFVQNPEVKKQLANVSMHNTQKILDAKLLIVYSVADDLDAFQKVVNTHLHEGLRDWYNQYKNQVPEQELRIWLARQVYIALGFSLSAIALLGLDSTPMEGIETEKYAEILNSKEYKPLFAVAVGYGATDDYYKPEAMPKSRRPINEIIKTI